MSGLSIERLQKVLNYNEETGELTWKERLSGRVKVGAKAGTKTRGGYIQVRIDGASYYSHRLVWYMNTGSWPLGVIDHINGDPTDNRMENLRDTTQKVNCQNTHKLKSSNTSGVQGVDYRGDIGKWRSRIFVNGKETNLGFFDTIEEGYAAYVRAKRKYHNGEGLNERTT